MVTAEHATFTGASAILAAQLRALQADRACALLGRIKRSRDSLSPAERRVADHVLAHPRSALGDPIAEIARASQVSQPTVIRFCRSLGSEGLSDFKLRLASGLSAAVPLTHTQVTGEDSMLELGVKVLGNTASASLQLREQLNRETLARAIDLLAAAERIAFYAVGHVGVVADDAQFKFLLVGVPSVSYTDPRLQLLAASVLKPFDVAVIISNTGRIETLLGLADVARQRGAPVLAITAGQSPLARKADVTLIVDHTEDMATQMPMISRILHLLMIDILAVGVAVKKGGPGTASAAQVTAAELDEHESSHAAAAAKTAGLGISAAASLARLTSHSR